METLNNFILEKLSIGNSNKYNEYNEDSVNWLLEDYPDLKLKSEENNPIEGHLRILSVSDNIDKAIIKYLSHYSGSKFTDTVELFMKKLHMDKSEFSYTTMRTANHFNIVIRNKESNTTAMNVYYNSYQRQIGIRIKNKQENVFESFAVNIIKYMIDYGKKHL